MPPPQQPGFGMQPEFYRPPGIYFEAIGDAWTLLTRDLGSWLLITLVLMLVNVVCVAPFVIAGMLIQNGGSFIAQPGEMPNVANWALGQFVSLMGNVISFPVLAGGFWVALKQVRGESISVGDIFEPFKYLGQIFGTAVLYSLALIIGLCLCVIPYFYLLGALSFAALLVVDKGMGPVDALQTSRTSLGSSAWIMLVFLLVVGFIAGLGVCLFGVGILITMPIYFLGVALHYNYYFPQQGASAGYVLPEYPQG